MPIRTADRTRALASLIEQAECTKVRRQLEAFSRLFPNSKTKARPLPCGGVAALATAAPNNIRLNHATGLAMNGEPVDEASIRLIENFYFSHGLAASIRIFPWVSPAAFQVLAARGFSAVCFLNTYVCSLHDITDVEGQGAPSGVVVSTIGPSEHETFIKYATAGFDGNGKSREFNVNLARMGTMVPNTLIYLATVEGIAAGTSMVEFLDTDSGELVAYSSFTSALPGFRGQGVAGALAAAQLQDAKKNGCRWIFSIGEVGNKNGEVRERLGYRLLHTKPLFRKTLPQAKAIL